MSNEPALLPLKTGAARIALGAAADAGIEGVVVVPVGLVYEEMGKFGRDVELQFGEPIEIDEWIDSYRTDHAKAVRGVTDLIADRLAQITMNHGSAEEAVVIDRAAALVLADGGVDSGAAEFVRRNELRHAGGRGVDGRRRLERGVPGSRGCGGRGTSAISSGWDSTCAT